MHPYAVHTVLLDIVTFKECNNRATLFATCTAATMQQTSEPCRAATARSHSPLTLQQEHSAAPPCAAATKPAAATAPRRLLLALRGGVGVGPGGAVPIIPAANPIRPRPCHRRVVPVRCQPLRHRRLHVLQKRHRPIASLVGGLRGLLFMVGTYLSHHCQPWPLQT